MVVALANRSSVASIPDARRLRPTLRDVHGHALAVSEIFRPDEGALTVFRPVVQPDGVVRICLQFERLPDDRAPASLTLGEETLPLALIGPVRVRARPGTVEGAG